MNFLHALINGVPHQIINGVLTPGVIVWPNANNNNNGSSNSSNSPPSQIAKTAKECSHLMQLDRIQVFKEQNHEKGHFDMALEVQGKKFFVHKYFLATASETFNAMISNRWNKNNDEVIKIENPDYSYENIYQLISFIYSCQCEITDANVFVLTDMAEFYGIPLLKEKCYEFLTAKEIKFDELENMVIVAIRYSMDKLVEVVKNQVSSSMLALVESEQFSSYKKPFVEFMAIMDKQRGELEEKFFAAVYKWAHLQATTKVTEEKVAALDFDDCIKAELKEILPNIKFSRMSYCFIRDSVVTKRSIFKVKELYKILASSNRNYHDQEEECFKILYDMAKKVVAESNDESDDKNIKEAIKKELADVLPKIEFHRMSIKFLIDFVVDFGIDLSLIRVYTCLVRCQKIKKEVAFKSVYLLAEKQVLKKNFLLQNDQMKRHDAVMKKLADVLVRVKLNEMHVTFWLDFAIDKGFVLSSSDFRNYFEQLKLKYSNHQELFKIIYQLAEKLVLKQQESSKIQNFNIYESVKNKLANILPSFYFPSMPLPFLLDSVVGKGLLLSTTMIRDFFLTIRNDYGDEEAAFKCVYRLAEKQAMEEQDGSADKTFNLSDAIKDELVDTLPIVRFEKMSRKFLDDFVVTKGFLTIEQANGLCIARVTIESGNTTITGIFDDKYGILKTIPSNGYFTTPHQNHKLRFGQLKFKIPTFPSTVSKMKGAQWYLCLDKNGYLTVIFHTLIATTDYLIAEMKSSDEFMLHTDQPAVLRASINNV